MMILRNRLDLKQQDLAEKLNVSRGYISNLENGKNIIPTETLIKLAEIFGTEINYFYPIKSDVDFLPKQERADLTTEQKVDKIENDVNEIKLLMFKFLSKV